MKLIIASFVLATLSRCAFFSDLSMERSIQNMRREALAKIDVNDCKSKGGIIRGVCMFCIPACIIPYADAGKNCTDSSQCKGLCWNNAWDLEMGASASGTCTADAQDCKCGVEIINGKVAGGVCED